MTRIRPPRRWDGINLRTLWNFRGLLWAFAARDIKLRYRQTALGVLWIVLQPLIGAGIFGFVFGRVAKLDSEGVPYALFAFVGLLGWNVFNGVVLKAATSLVANASLISKVAFPRLVLPVSGALATMLDTTIGLVSGMVLILFTGIRPGLAILTLPVWLGLLLIFALGIGFMVAALAVAYRDVVHILPVALQMLLYASPVGYGASNIPGGLIRNLFNLNPLAPLLERIRWSLLGTTPADVPSTIYAALVAVLCFGCGLVFFHRRELQFADVI